MLEDYMVSFTVYDLKNYVLTIRIFIKKHMTMNSLHILIKCPHVNPQEMVFVMTMDHPSSFSPHLSSPLTNHKNPPNFHYDHVGRFVMMQVFH
ncbi:hypothetical protein QVD17_18813 [Tagetes erecta]|uniref:Uncharacterized protein n=1 Tax=Tagetes erecta TaxID=13708 RepID=A0AAD8NPE5_TARER|nr:hypothetical protein QVD17_18813 [Tagetes erecta]